MNHPINRRDFLKLAGLLSASYALPNLFIQPRSSQPASEAENVIVLVFDAFSAYHLSLYGYARNTTPNIDRLAEKAIVYHNHFAGGNFTTPGTASLLTGTLSWTHRATGAPLWTVTKEFKQRSLFHALPNYYRMAYSHNPLVNNILDSFFKDIDSYTAREKLFRGNDVLVNTFFKNDEDIASLSWARAIKRQEERTNYPLFLSQFYDRLIYKKYETLLNQFPRGLPNINTDNYFLLEDGMDWLNTALTSAPQPFLGYFHFLPPHHPYLTRHDFAGAFAKDGYLPPEKPVHLLEGLGFDPVALLTQRQWYDEFILYVDSEFERFYRMLDQGGILKNTWLILTSDHGELFERGVRGHSTPILHQPVVRIPLIIFPPEAHTRIDVYENTSAIDLLPTLVHLAGQTPVDWPEGTILPPFLDKTVPSRDIFVLEAEGTEQDSPILRGTVMLVKENYKLMFYFGYEELAGSELIELYDIRTDPEELINLYPEKKGVGDELVLEVKAKLDEVNRSKP